MHKLENSSQPSVEQLRAESLTDQEVHELLERLGAKEFGGAENSTIGAVAEATGNEPEAIGRLLADIRKEDFEKRFGLQLGEHEARIETLEERTERLQKSQSTRESIQPRPIDPYAQAALDRLAEREQQREAMRPFAIVLAILILIVFVIALGNKNSRRSSPDLLPTVSTPVADGDLTMDEQGNIWVQKPDGTRREPTADERGKVMGIGLAVGNH